MKICPKCESEHNKPGTYCSRSCGNSRTVTEEQRKLLSEKAKQQWQNLSIEEREKWKDEKRIHLTKAREVALEQRKQQLSEKPFNDFSFDYKRKIVINEQNGKCIKCGIDSWLGQPITLEIDHIDGNNRNNVRENLEALCPNCHSLTPTWRGRNKVLKKVSDDEIIDALNSTDNIHQALLKVGLSAKGRNYKRLEKLSNELII